MRRSIILIILLTALSCSVAFGEVAPPPMQNQGTMQELPPLNAEAEMQASYRREVTKILLGEEELRIKAFDQSRYTSWVILALVSTITAVGFAFSLFLILKASSQRGHQPVSDL